MKRKKRKCLNCRFWLYKESYGEGNEWAECHKRSATCSHLGEAGYWPRTIGINSCGDWKRRKQKLEAPSYSVTVEKVE